MGKRGGTGKGKGKYGERGQEGGGEEKGKRRGGISPPRSFLKSWRVPVRVTVALYYGCVHKLYPTGMGYWLD